jgi:hypothetical protein
MLATCFDTVVLLGLFFNPESEGDMFLQKMNWLSTDQMMLYSR